MKSLSVFVITALLLLLTKPPCYLCGYRSRISALSQRIHWPCIHSTREIQCNWLCILYLLLILLKSNFVLLPTILNPVLYAECYTGWTAIIYYSPIPIPNLSLCAPQCFNVNVTFLAMLGSYRNGDSFFFTADWFLHTLHVLICKPEQKLLPADLVCGFSFHGDINCSELTPAWWDQSLPSIASASAHMA